MRRCLRDLPRLVFVRLGRTKCLGHPVNGFPHRGALIIVVVVVRNYTGHFGIDIATNHSASLTRRRKHTYTLDHHDVYMYKTRLIRLHMQIFIAWIYTFTLFVFWMMWARVRWSAERVSIIVLVCCRAFMLAGNAVILFFVCAILRAIFW